MKHYVFEGLEFDLPEITLASELINDEVAFEIREGPLEGTMFSVCNFVMSDTEENLLHYDLKSNLEDNSKQKMLEEIVGNLVLSILIDQTRKDSENSPPL